MKHNMNRILTTMALLVLTTITAWAEQKVKITVTPENSGTVTYEIVNGSSVKLTCKPGNGYWLSKDYIKAVTSLDGGAVQAPQKRIPVDEGTELTITDGEGNTDVAGETTYYFDLPADQNLNVEVTATFQSRTSIEGATVTVVYPNGGIIYNGEEQKPAIASVVLAGTTLTSADYTVSGYSNNINVGNEAEVTVEGQGKYTGSATGKFTISKADLSTVTVGAIADQTFNGAEIKPAVTVTFNGKAVAEDEYSVAYSDNINAGTATVTLTSKDKSFSTEKTKTATFKIVAKALTADMVADIAAQAYTGSPLTPAVTVTDGDAILVVGEDYAVSYADNVNVGVNTATATITGKGNYSGTASKTFTIIAKSLSTGYTVSVDATQTYTYTGSEIKPTAVTVTPAAGGTALVQGKDYTITGYANNINAATADAAAAPTVTVTGMGNYTGSASGTFTIGKAQLTDLKVALEGWTYGEEPKTPVVTGNLGNGAVTFTYQAEGATEFTETVPTNAGSHVVKAVVAESDNYLGAEATSNFTIAKASVTLSFSAEYISTPVNETPEWPVLNNPKGVKVVYRSSNTAVAEVNETTGEVKIMTPGTTIIMAVVNDPNYEPAEATYLLEVTSYAYKLKIDGKVVTEENRKSLFEDGSVIFNGVNRLYLTDASITSIESGLDKLEIYIKGENEIVAGKNDAIKDLTGGEQELMIITAEEPGSLKLSSDIQVVSGFKKIDLYQPLSILDENITELNAAGITSVNIGVPIMPLVSPNNISATVDYNANPGDVAGSSLTSIVINNILYTLNDTQTPNVVDDGFYDGKVVLNSVMGEDEIDRIMSLEPGSPVYNDLFKGLTFMVPAGTGKIMLNAFVAEGHALCVKIGNNWPSIFKGPLKEDVTLLVPYACTEDTYVRIYHTVVGQDGALSNSHRIGPKATVSTGIGSLQVSADQIDTPPADQADYLSLSRDDIMIPEGGAGHIIVENEKVTDLDGNTFETMFDNEDMAPKRRAYGNYDITYIDLRGTSITGKVFSRDEEPFKGLPETTFIYLPAGNIVSGKNMVVGSVCDSLLLGNDYYSFECAPGGFTATTAILERPFEADKKKPFYVPFALSNHEDYGTFFEFDELKNGVVEMKKATTVAANTAYYLQAKEGGVENIEAQCVQVEPLEEEPYSGLIGTYMPIALFSDSYVYDNDLKQFRKGNLDYAAPFEVYLSINSNESTLLTHWEGEPAPTAVEAVRTESAETNQWYSLDGRKLQEQPTRKGVYLKNSKKLVVK